MNIQEAASLVGLAAAALPNIQDKDLTPTAKFWAVVMPDIDYKIGQAAIIRIMREKKYATLPLPAEIIEVARELRKSPNSPPCAIEAWEEVRKKIDLYNPTRWSHPAIEFAVRRIGVRNICGSDFNISKRFMDTYDQIIRRRILDAENQIAIQITAGGEINLLGFEGGKEN